MDNSTMRQEWDRFSKMMNGKVIAAKADYTDHDSHYKISIGDTTVELNWGEQPQKGRGPHVTLESIFRYPLQNSGSTILKIYPKDPFSKFLTLFSGKKKKTGIPELDNSYIFISNSSSLVIELEEEFKLFHQRNNYKDFVVEIEAISDVPTVVVYLTGLVTDYETLDFYYKFGLHLKKIIDQDHYYAANVI